MNVYDFDGTIFQGDCERQFLKYVSKRKGFRFCRLKFCLLELVSRKIPLLDRTSARQIQYSFLKKVEDLDALLEGFWSQAERNIKPWYLKARSPNDIIASGTPKFLIEPAVRRLGAGDLVATDMDPKTGMIRGRFAVGRQKFEYFSQRYDPRDIDIFYSDAYSDRHFAQFAKKAVFVHGKNKDRRSDWQEYFLKKRRAGWKAAKRGANAESSLPRPKAGERV